MAPATVLDCLDLGWSKPYTACMTIYAIGDVQGCLVPLQALLKTIAFNEQDDTLWLTGDLVNRGPQSLDTLRFVRDLGDSVITVLGNHDLYLLAIAHGACAPKRKDTLHALLQAPDCDDLLSWLIARPLLHVDHAHHALLVHAGIPPLWDLHTAQHCAQQLSTVLKGPKASDYFANMMGDTPAHWDPSLPESMRLVYITNALTRMRYCDQAGNLCLKHKHPPTDKQDDLIPWFSHPLRRRIDLRIVFGHWAALGGVTNTADCLALDTGCVWGNHLTALRLHDEKRFCVACSVASTISR